MTGTLQSFIKISVAAMVYRSRSQCHHQRGLLVNLADEPSRGVCMACPLPKAHTSCALMTLAPGIQEPGGEAAEKSRRRCAVQAASFQPHFSAACCSP